MAEVVRDALPEPIKHDPESATDGSLSSLTKQTLEQAAPGREVPMQKPGAAQDPYSPNCNSLAAPFAGPDQSNVTGVSWLDGIPLAPA